MITWIINKLIQFANYVMSVLPTSPFQPFIQQMADIPYLGYVNWFIPVGDCLKIGVAWLVSIGLFYLYSIVMRWVKMIG